MSVVLVLSIFVRIFSVYLSVHLLQGIYWIMIWHSDSYQPMQRSLSFDSQWQQTVNDINQLVHIHVNQPCEVDKYEGTSSSCFVQLINVAVSPTRTDVECVWCCCIQPWTQGVGLSSWVQVPVHPQYLCFNCSSSFNEMWPHDWPQPVVWLDLTNYHLRRLSGSCCRCISFEGFLVHWFCSVGKKWF